LKCSCHPTYQAVRASLSSFNGKIVLPETKLSIDRAHAMRRSGASKLLSGSAFVAFVGRCRQSPFDGVIALSGHTFVRRRGGSFSIVSTPNLPVCSRLDFTN
jgi:hypothetical protein